MSLETVRTWPKSRDAEKRRLGAEWAKIMGRHVKWKTAFSHLVPIPQKSSSFQPKTFLSRIRQVLPRAFKKIDIRVDFAYKDPRPINLLQMGGFQIFVWNPGTGKVDKESLQAYLQHLPARMITLRIFSQDHSHDTVFAQAAEETLRKHWPELLHTS